MYIHVLACESIYRNENNGILNAYSTTLMHSVYFECSKESTVCVCVLVYAFGKTVYEL